jgi:hypothetical protein
LLDVRYAPIATKFCIAAKRRDVPTADIDSPNSGLFDHLVGEREQP